MLRRLAGKLAFLAPLWRRFGTACGPLWRQNGALAPFWPRFCTALAQNLHCFVIVLPAAENLNACAADVCARARAHVRGASVQILSRREYNDKAVQILGQSGAKSGPKRRQSAILAPKRSTSGAKTTPKRSQKGQLASQTPEHNFLCAGRSLKTPSPP